MTKTKSQKARAKAKKYPHNGGKKHPKNKNMRKRHNKARNQLVHYQTSGRALLHSSIPTPYMNLRSTATGAICTGEEIIAEFNTSQYPTTFAMQLNPTLAQFFPKLSAFASIWERFRFKKVTAKYHTAAPSIRSGLAAIAVHTDIVSYKNVPVKLELFGNFAYSKVGSIAENFNTFTWNNEDPEFFFTGSQALASLDPLKVFQGTVCALLNKSSAADSDQLAGFLTVSYECEFRNSRPQKPVAALYTGPLVDLKVEAVGQVVPLPLSADPYNGTNNEEVLPSTAVGIWSTSEAKEASNGFWSALAQVCDGIQAGVDFVAATYEFLAEGATPADSEKKKRGMTTFDDAPVVTYYYNPATCKGHMGWIPLDEEDVKWDEKHNAPMWIVKHRNRTAAVTGDITVSVYQFDHNDSQPTTSFGAVYTGSTAAVTIAVPPTQCTLLGNSSLISFVECPFAGDFRYLDHHDFQITVDNVMGSLP